ncbi:LysR family substrate-binding domain-containing protein [Georgenia subflava]|uniref:LysR family transcriptional regulator n=1 Tax=Georgenia subflava TaxID=1622177 RepID=A0A6N7EPG3_9MICO|nr:LysR family substrate-binding domain-containing protein [Georgenia subflava]MPV39008.1 LysR family transcriptional regulator [Georgenia subflava]
MAEPFRVGFVPGVTPDKWRRIWTERMPGNALELTPVDVSLQTRVLHEGQAEMCLVRLPIEREGLHVIPLYREVPVVVVSKEHPVAAFDEVDVSDLADEHLLQEPEDVPEWAAVARELRDGGRDEEPAMTVEQAIEVAASGAGIVIVPLSLARLYHRKDVTHRPVTGVAESQIGLAWRVDDDDPRVEAFIGIVRGRTARSSRGGQPEPQSPANRSASRTPPRGPRPPRRASRRRHR